MAPRANVADIARRNDILPQQLYAWRREARERMESDDAPAFVPAMVEEPKAQGSGAEIRINIKGMTIRIQIGRASCRERVCQYVLLSVVAVSIKKQNNLHED